MNTATGYHIRWMIRRDMPEVLAIEAASFDAPWTEEDFLLVLRDRTRIGMIVESDTAVVGFMIYSLHKRKLEIDNFAVRPDCRRRGVGRKMITRLIGKLQSHRRTALTVTVRERFLPMQLLLKSCGFKATTVLRNHFDGPPEDGYRMVYSLSAGYCTDDDDSLEKCEW